MHIDISKVDLFCTTDMRCPLTNDTSRKRRHS